MYTFDTVVYDFQQLHAKQGHEKTAAKSKQMCMHVLE